MEKFPQSWHSINLVIELLVTDEEVFLDFEELGWVESNPLIVKKRDQTWQVIFYRS